MINEKKAIEIAKSFARDNRYGWDESFYEAKLSSIDGKSVWLISTLDIKHFKELPWMMEEMPSPIHYFIDMSLGECIAVKGRGDITIKLK
ncbi:hypothetical protein [Rosenbergiella australiborealis]|uniref:hypothetical protein n=1 Tax=Rosenbergiella australiborealis TaxID=1544696 RepID=UPI001F4F0D2D|nr:hypothetical protein [Rosenbergiella australiborealis]